MALRENQKVVCVEPVADHDGVYAAYRQYRFRPVTEQKRETSISIFKEILDRENHGLPSRVDYPADCEPK